MNRDFKENRTYYISLKRPWQIQNMRWLRSSSLYVTLQRVIVPAPLRTSGIIANKYAMNRQKIWREHYHQIAFTLVHPKKGVAIKKSTISMRKSLVYFEFQLTLQTSVKEREGGWIKYNFLSPVYRGKPKQEENNSDRLIADSIYELTPNCNSLWGCNMIFLSQVPCLIWFGFEFSFPF